MHLDLLAWTVLGLVGVVVSHELTHVLIAHAHGHRTVCVAVNPIGVAVVFEDTPCPRYLAWQADWLALAAPAAPALIAAVVTPTVPALVAVSEPTPLGGSGR